jgi:hypothetical protein
MEVTVGIVAGAEIRWICIFFILAHHFELVNSPKAYIQPLPCGFTALRQITGRIPKIFGEVYRLYSKLIASGGMGLCRTKRQSDLEGPL